MQKNDKNSDLILDVKKSPYEKIEWKKPVMRQLETRRHTDTGSRASEVEGQYGFTGGASWVGGVPAS